MISLFGNLASFNSFIFCVSHFFRLIVRKYSRTFILLSFSFPLKFSFLDQKFLDIVIFPPVPALSMYKCWYMPFITLLILHYLHAECGIFFAVHLSIFSDSMSPRFFKLFFWNGTAAYQSCTCRLIEPIQTQAHRGLPPILSWAL